MKKFLATTAIASAVAFPALADDTDIDQSISALQAALNSIVINNDGENVTQAATNAANLILSAGTSDIPVAQEASLTASAMGSTTPLTIWTT